VTIDKENTTIVEGEGSTKDIHKIRLYLQRMSLRPRSAG
jgi:hypothetical protein